MAPALQQFKFVAARLARTTTSLDDIQGSSWSSGSEEAKQLNSYISSIGTGPTPPVDALNFWSQQEHQYHKLAPVAQDLLAVPASQAYVERIFSVCGLLTAERRNRMNTSLEMRACLKLNSRVLKETGFVFCSRVARLERRWGYRRGTPEQVIVIKATNTCVVLLDILHSNICD